MLRRRILIAMVLASALVGTAACSSPAAAPKGAARILIEFRDPVDGAAARLLSELGERSGATIRYESSVSTRMHAYQLVCPTTDAGCAVAIEQLRRTPAIRSVSANQLRRPTQKPSKP